MSLLIGVDPGVTGAAVALDGGLVVGMAAWSRGTAAGGEAYRLRVHTLEYGRRPDEVQPTPERVAEWTWIGGQLGTDARWVVEDLYVGPSPRAALDLATWTGRFIAGACLIGAPEPSRVSAPEWRRATLGRAGKLRAAEWEALAVESFGARWPGAASDVARWTRAERGAVAEAAHMALWLGTVGTAEQVTP